MISEILKYVKPKGIIHVGAHEGQEYESYIEVGIERMMFFEPIESNFMKLVRHVRIGGEVHAYNLALGNETGQKEMFVETANQGMSCSLLEPSYHLTQFPWIEFNEKEIVKIDKLDNIKFNRKNYNILIIDVQGFELEVLKGAIWTLNFIDAVFVETNREEMYKGCAFIRDIDSFLSEFKRVSEDFKGTFGDVLYIR